MSRNHIEFANVLCHFGADKVLLDYLDEIVLPAFTDDTLIRQRGKETPTHYHFYEVGVEVLVSVPRLPESFESVGGRRDVELEPAASTVIRYAAPIREVPDVDDRKPPPLRP